MIVSSTGRIAISRIGLDESQSIKLVSKLLCSRPGGGYLQRSIVESRWVEQKVLEDVVQVAVRGARKYLR
jgi:hypothetical protein